MAKKSKLPKIDGLSAEDLAKVRTAIRQIWHRSHPRKLAVARGIGAGGYSFCEKCKKRAPKTFVDHIHPVGDILNGGIERMFVSSQGLQNLCKKCHDEKTKVDKAGFKKAVSKRVKKIDTDDFF